jgi:arylsulfatase A-like enzyme/Tfp pilus assembly protein PilF
MPFLFFLFSQSRPSVLLVTIDTVRRDAIAPYAEKNTPALAAFARQALVFERAMTTAPLTLPAHASILSGRFPADHGLRLNGRGRLPTAIPTLAQHFHQAGYATAAFVSSRVLDRVFGLDRGFDRYDDELNESQIGEYGYAERSAPDTVSRCIEWIDKSSARPVFVWLHLYDPHAPYEGEGTLRERYDGELERVDQALARVLPRFPQASCLVAITGDHGESLGEHGEATHGLFLYQSVIQVPLLLAGPGVQQGRQGAACSIAQIAASLAALAGLPAEPSWLPALPFAGGKENVLSVLQFETIMPLEAYGWSPQYGILAGEHKWIETPKAECYKPFDDPLELHNLLPSKELEALRVHLRGTRPFSPEKAQPVPELDAALASLGYAAGSKGLGPLRDAKDGVVELHRYLKAKQTLQEGKVQLALAELEDLVRRNPGNLPFLNQLAHAYQETGQPDRAIPLFQAAVRLSPELHFTHLNLARCLHQFQQISAARESYWAALDRFPRAESAWLGLAELAHGEGNLQDERAILNAALEAGVQSAALHLALAAQELASGQPAQSLPALREALRLEPRHWLAWYLLGTTQFRMGRLEAALEALLKAFEIQPDHLALRREIADLYLRLGQPEKARSFQAFGDPGSTRE